MKKIGTYFKDYAAYHRTRGNKVCHVYGITLIVMTLFGLLDRLVLFRWGLPVNASAALALWLVGNGFYLILHFKLGMTMVVSTSILYFVGTLLPLPLLWVLFVAGWIMQGIGHYVYEKKSPAFLKNFVHVLVGPAFIQNYYLKIYRG